MGDRPIFTINQKIKNWNNHSRKLKRKILYIKIRENFSDFLFLNYTQNFYYI